MASQDYEHDGEGPTSGQPPHEGQSDEDTGSSSADESQQESDFH